MDQDPVPIILFGQRRSGTTIAFKLFREVKSLRCYYEPLHPWLIRHTDWSGPELIETDAKQVMDEYCLLDRRQFQDRYAPLGAPVYPVQQELNAAYWSERHSDYIRYLLDSSPATLLQPVRVNYHLASLSRVDPGMRFIWVLRNPRGVVSSLLQYKPEQFPFGPPPGQQTEAGRKGIRGAVGRAWRRRPLQKRPASPRPRRRRSGNPWSQGDAARILIQQNPRYAQFAEAPLYIQLLVACYDAVDRVSHFFDSMPKENTSVIRYEDLCRDPDAILTASCKWAGLPVPSSSVRSLVSPSPACPYCEDNPGWETAEQDIQSAVYGESGRDPALPATRIGPHKLEIKPDRT